MHNFFLCFSTHVQIAQIYYLCYFSLKLTAFICIFTNRLTQSAYMCYNLPYKYDRNQG